MSKLLIALFIAFSQTACAGEQVKVIPMASPSPAASPAPVMKAEKKAKAPKIVIKKEEPKKEEPKKAPEKK
jgi:hypothetical protein